MTELRDILFFDFFTELKALHEIPAVSALSSKRASIHPSMLCELVETD